MTYSQPKLLKIDIDETAMAAIDISAITKRFSNLIQQQALLS